MKVYKFFLWTPIFGALIVGACDLQPKIVSIPDSIGMFIEDRYPALLADPEQQPEIYNSAVTDYGVYASPELYGSENINDYVLYASADDYILIPESETLSEPVAVTEHIEKSDSEIEQEIESEIITDYIIVPVYGGNRLIDEIDVKDNDKKSDKKDIDKINEDARPDEIIVVRGDTVYALAKKYNMSVDEFAKINNLSAPYTLKIGQKLTTRAPGAEQKQETKQETLSEDKTDIKQNESGEIIVVRGDTVYALAKKYNMSVDEFAKINNLSAPYTLKIGQKLTTRKSTVAPVQKTVIEKKKEIPNVISVEKVQQIKTEKMAAVKPVVKTTVAKRIDLTEITLNSGDTLYSISRKYEIPVNDLAIINKISAPFTLMPGQKLKVPKLDKVQTKSISEIKNKPQNSVRVATKIPAKTGDKKISSKSQTAQKSSYTKVEEKTKSKKSDVVKKESSKIASRSSSKFSWPLRGAILSGYGPKQGGLVNDGINIAGTIGAMVKAAENGVVAYAGNEVKGMGNLIIIQHSDGWMTVYAHLNSMNVRRGAKVNVGQNIGTVGKTGKVDKPQLHFEIRKGTRAYNPTQYLKK